MDYEGSTASLERASDLEKNPAGVVKRWLLELKLADKREQEWRKASQKVWNKYRQTDAKRHSFNILWANTETLRPAVYNSLPSPDVRRRYKDHDPVGKAVSEVLSRSLEYGLDVTDFDTHIKSTVLDMLLPGRGVCRVRYVPSLAQVGVTEETHDELAEQHEDGGEALEGSQEELEWEQVPIEHVQWDDFRISTGKEWDEVCWVAFRHRLTRDELVEQFGEVGNEVDLDATDDEEISKERDEKIRESFKTAEVWEIWDKDELRVLFICEGYKSEPLKVLADPLGLQGFYPVPRPLYAIEDSSSTVPVPLYELYKEQAEELDRVSARINTLIQGLKMRGVYDATISEMSEVMRGQDNDLIPAQNVTALLERGGLEKAIWWMPIEQAAIVLRELYTQREQCKAVIYEITGISDILRGSTDSNETATAQQIKSQWGSNRLKRLQQETQRFIRDLIRIQAELIGEKFQLETLQTMTGLKLPTMMEKQQAMMAQQMGQQVPPELLQMPTWEEVIQVMRDDKLRTFKVDVETDSTIAASIESDMQGLTEVLGGVTQLVQGLGPAVQLGALPVEALKEIILSVVRRAKMGNAVEDALDKMQAPPPPEQPQEAPDNSIEVEQLKQQGQAQLKSAEMQHGAQIEQMKLEHQTQVEAMKAQMEAQRLEFDRWKAELDANTKIIVAELQAKTSIATTELSAQTSKETTAMGLSAKDETSEYSADGESKPKSGLNALVEAMNKNMIELMQAQDEKNERLIQAVTRPKVATLSNGKQVRVE